MSNREKLEFQGLFNSKAENLTPESRCYAMQNASTDRGILEVSPRYSLLGARTSANAGDIGWGMGYGKYAGNETQRIRLTGNPTGGDFTLTFDNGVSSQTTLKIARGALASGPDTGTGVVTPYQTVQAALEALSTINIGDVYCTGGPLPTVPIDVEFRGQYLATDVALMTGSAAGLTGGTAPAVVVEELTKGGTAEEMLVAVQKNGETTVTMYKVDLDTGAFTSVATGLTASDWLFRQYNRRIYAINRADGLHFKTLGGSWDNGTTAAKPAAPSSAPTIQRFQHTPSTPDFTGATFGDFVNFGSNPTCVGGDGFIRLTLNANVTDKTLSFTADLAADEDCQYLDLFWVNVQHATADISFQPDSFMVELLDGTPTTTTPPFLGTGTYDSGIAQSNRKFQFAHQNRSNRKTTVKYKFTFAAFNGSNTKSMGIHCHHYDNWQCNGTDLNVDTGPIQDHIQYAYSYWDEANQVESDLSPEVRSGLVPLIYYGEYQILKAKGSTALAVTDKVYFYRLEKSTGLWRRLPNADATYGVANNPAAGTTVNFNDHHMEDELADFPAYGLSGLPSPSTGVYPNQIGVWKQCLVIGTKLLWLSGVGLPTSFAPAPDSSTTLDPDESDPDRPRTLYMSDDRSEEVTCIAGQDSLYSFGALSGYGMVGDKPASATSPRRLPGARGCPSRRGYINLGGGVVLASEDGLWYYAVERGSLSVPSGNLLEREETQDVRGTWEDLVGSTDCTSIVVVEHRTEIWAFNATRYFKISRNGQFEEGTLSASVKAALSVRPRSLYLLDSKGRVLTVGRMKAKTGATITTDEGADVAWSYATGLLDGARVKIIAFEVQAVGQVKITVNVYDGSRPLPSVIIDTPEEGQVFRFPCSIPPGFRYRLTFSGTSASRIESLAVHYDQVGPGKGT